MSNRREEHSVLDDLGAEVTGIAFPVSICMALTIFLVRLLNQEEESSQRSIIIAEIVEEDEDATAASKFRGSIINALVFVGIVTAMTFIIVLLFKYGCVKLIYAYMGFATFMIFFFMTGGILIDVLQTVNIHMDAFSVVFILLNFSLVGSTILFFVPAPLLLKQQYLMWTGIVVAYIFTAIPPWTTWVLLVAMALYDLFAVLTPQGPLQMLVNLAIERNEEIPALVYEAREVRRQRRRGADDPSGTTAPPTTGIAEGLISGDQSFNLFENSDDQPGSGRGATRRHMRSAVPVGESSEASGRGIPGNTDRYSHVLDSELAQLHRPEGLADGSDVFSSGIAVMEAARAEDDTLVSPEDATESLLAATEPTSGVSTPGGAPPPAPVPEMSLPAAQMPVDDPQEEDDGRGGRRLRRRDLQREDDEVDDPYELGIPSAVKLGLGDFIFYSVLVGRASLYDWLTVYSSFISVIAGLGITLWLLAVMKKALPALPVSIALGIMFYFLTRAVLEAFVVPPFVHMVAW